MNPFPNGVKGFWLRHLYAASLASDLVTIRISKLIDGSRIPGTVIRARSPAL